jgi:hypothetical protein
VLVAVSRRVNAPLIEAPHLTKQEGAAMELDKDTILNFLRERGEADKADQASQELPEKVDTDRDAGLLERYGIDTQELLSKFGGGIPGLGS